MFLTTVSLLVLLCLSQIKNMSTDFIRSLWLQAFILTWSPGSVVLDVADLTPADCLPLHPEAGCAGPTGPGCTDPLWTERSRTEPNRTELSRTEPNRSKEPFRPALSESGWRLSYQPGLCSCVPVWMEAPGGPRRRIGPLLVLMLCCSAAPGHAERVSEHTPIYTQTHARARAHTHAHRWSGDGSDAFIDK